MPRIEAKRRVVGKAIMNIINEDVQKLQKAAGPLQLCAGQSAVEAAVHVMRELFAADETDAVLLIDADSESKGHAS